MPLYKFKRLLFLAFILSFSTISSAQLTVNSALLDFGDVQTGSRDSLLLIVDGPSQGLWKVENYFPDFTLSDTVPPQNGSAPDTITVYFAPVQNIRYQGVLILRHRMPYGTDVLELVTLRGNGRYNDSYYSSTFDLSEEDLKTQLKQIISGHTSLGYNSARDEMFMKIDNQKVNGQGAAQNTLEGVYTGKKAVGYTSRSDAQNRFDFNTEHTFPQGQFNSAEPMKSDIHHLFPTKAYANSERGNKPFGVVNNPNWQEGGSKSNNSYFEPRDEQKGATARAMLYFLIRYKNYNNYVSSKDQGVLIDWARTFEPNAKDIRRNEDIYKVQKNRNPFVDHPEFLDRIHNFIGFSKAPEIISYGLSSQKLVLDIYAVARQKARFGLVNNGNTDLSVVSAASMHHYFEVDSFDHTMLPGEAAQFYLTWDLDASFTNDTLRIELDNGDMVAVPVEAILHVGAESHPVPSFSIYPVPAHDRLNVNIKSQNAVYIIYSADGRPVLNGVLTQAHSFMNLQNLSPGFYLFQINDGEKTEALPLIITAQ